MIASPQARRVLVVAFVLTSTFRLAAQAPGDATAELSQWIESDRIGRTYESVKSDLLDVFRRAGTRDLPAELLLNLVYEGAAKRVSAPLLASALSLELERLELADSIIDELEMIPGNEREYTRALRAMSIALQTGIERAVLSTAFHESPVLERGISAIETITDIATYSAVDTGDLVSLVHSLVASRMKSESFASITSAYVKGRLSGMTTGDITRVVVTVLRSGGGIIQIDQELSRRGRNR